MAGEEKVPKVMGIRLRDYMLLDELGRGSFGVVYKARKKEERGYSYYAIKRLHYMKDLKNSKRELQIADKLPEHPNLVRVFEYFFHPKKPRVYIVMEYCEVGNLNDYIIKGKPPLEQLLPFMLEMAKAVGHLHKNRVMHRDLKPENVLLTRIKEQLVCKVADFSISRILPDTQLAETLCGTSWYVAPEVLNHSAYGFEVDIFSLGVVYYTMVTQFTVTYGKNKEEILTPTMEHNRKEKPVSVVARTSGIEKKPFVEIYFAELPALGELVHSMLQENPSQRPDATTTAVELAEMKGSVQGRHQLRGAAGRSGPRRSASMFGFQRPGEADSGLSSFDDDIKDGEIEVMSLSSIRLEDG